MLPVTATEAPVLHVMDTDNLTVRQRIQLPQTMSGRTVISSDASTAYAVSVGGVLVLPIATLGTAPSVAALQEDVVFLGDYCNRQIISKFVTIVDQSGGHVDFKLSLPDGTKGGLATPDQRSPHRLQVRIDAGSHGVSELPRQHHRSPDDYIGVRHQHSLFPCAW